MTLQGFIRSNRTELDKCIRQALGDSKARFNDEERRQWILNDEGLYLWAKGAGVKI